MLTKAQEARHRAYLKETTEEDRWLVQVSDCPASAGVFWLLPIFGWFEMTPQIKAGACLLSGKLLRIADLNPVGTATWVIPLSEGNRPKLLAVLAALGWDARIWPFERGWPDDTPEAEWLQSILSKSHVTNTLVFPPHPERGYRCIRVCLPKTSGQFPCTIDVEAEALPVNEAQQARFDALVKDPEAFCVRSLNYQTKI